MTFRPRTDGGDGGAPRSYGRCRALPKLLAEEIAKEKAPLNSSLGSEPSLSIPMQRFRKEQLLVLCSLPVLLLLGGCGGPTPECDSPDARNSVVKMVSDDSNNALVNYALENSSSVAALLSNANSEAEKRAIRETARQAAVYSLDDTIHINSRSRATRTVTCSGSLEVTVADTTAQKDIEFKLELTADGKLLVSVSPFLF